MKVSSPHLIISCEHGGKRIPARYQYLFTRAQSALDSHRGWDRGALQLARYLSHALAAPLLYSQTSRLLVELNRSLHHPQLFSEFSRLAPVDVRRTILDKYYFPYRDDLERKVRESTLRKQRVVHLSAHSFTPRLRRVTRNADIGLLYDPARAREREFCHAIKLELKKSLPQYRVRMNYPYRGNADGLTTCMRKRFDGDCYLGIEIELNQKLTTIKKPAWNRLLRTLCGAVHTSLENIR